MCTCAHVTIDYSHSEPGEVPRPPPVPLGDLLSSFSVMVRWNHPTDPNGVVLRYIVNYVAVSSTPPQGMRRRRRETDGVKVECILGQDMNINRNMTVDGTQTSATLTELSECTLSYVSNIYLTVVSYIFIQLLALCTTSGFRLKLQLVEGHFQVQEILQPLRMVKAYCYLQM